MRKLNKIQYRPHLIDGLPGRNRTVYRTLVTTCTASSTCVAARPDRRAHQGEVARREAAGISGAFMAAVGPRQSATADAGEAEILSSGTSGSGAILSVGSTVAGGEPDSLAAVRGSRRARCGRVPGVR
jgi:hypothetical protein